MKLGDHKPSGADWIQENKCDFLSPKLEGPGEERLKFPDCSGEDYRVDVKITPTSGVRIHGKKQREAAALFRYSNRHQYYYAGIGGWGKKVFIAKVDRSDGKDSWSCLASAGHFEHISFDETYRIRVECRGRQITLSQGDQILGVEDRSFEKGCVGLRVVNSRALFTSFQVEKIAAGPPRVFVLMPFSPAFLFVWEVIRDTVVSKGLDCDRSDTLVKPGPILDDVKKQILGADIIIADLTGRNSNVYYEAGYAHGKDKEPILLAQSSEDPAFLLSGYRTVLYKSPNELRRLLGEALDKLLREKRLVVK